MHRGTTPVHTFVIPHSMANVDFNDLYISYMQNDQIILEKTLSDVSRDKCKIEVPLSQEETLLFTEGVPTFAQIRLKDEFGSALASQYVPIKVHPIIKDGEI